MMRLLIVAAGAALLAGCAPMDRQANEAALAEVRPLGEPVDCLNVINIRDTRVRGDAVIDFTTRSGEVYRNTLPNGCPGLGFQQSFSYRTSLTRLCSVDTITVLYTGGGPQQGATCGLGRFQRIETPAR